MASFRKAKANAEYTDLLRTKKEVKEAQKDTMSLEKKLNDCKLKYEKLTKSVHKQKKVVESKVAAFSAATEVWTGTIDLTVVPAKYVPKAEMYTGALRAEARKMTEEVVTVSE
jgi:uncharacterized protein YlxW (UPF0749 family)